MARKKRSMKKSSTRRRSQLNGAPIGHDDPYLPFEAAEEGVGLAIADAGGAFMEAIDLAEEGQCTTAAAMFNDGNYEHGAAAAYLAMMESVPHIPEKYTKRGSRAWSAVRKELAELKARSKAAKAAISRGCSTAKPKAKRPKARRAGR